MLGRVWALIVKELTSLWSDRKTRYVLLIPPIVQVFIFANAANYDVTRVPFGIWNEDAGVQAAELVRRFTFSPGFKATAAFDNPAAVQEAIDSKTVVAVLHVPQEFSANVLAGRAAPVQLLVDARRSNAALMVSGYAGEIVARYDADLRPRQPPPVAIEVTDLFNPSLDSKWFILPGLVVVLSLMMTMMVSALSLARERELGTFEQMLVTPLRPAELMFGKAVPALMVGMLEANIVFLVARLLFGLPFAGDFLVLETALAVFCLAGVGIGLSISSFTATQQQGILGVFVYASPAIVISGYASPVENMPPLLQWLSLADPIRYMLVIARGMFLENLPLDLVLAQAWPMALIAALTLVLATVMVRRAIA